MDYYKPVNVGNFWSKCYIESMKAVGLEIKHYRLNNVLITLNHT